MNYSIKKESKYSFDETVEKTIASLAKEGFGILTQIDVKKTLKDKIGVDFKRYVILGACNPTSAHQALLVEEELGLFLPCNVLVYENDDGKIFVSAVRPTIAMQMIKNDALLVIAESIEEKLQKVIDSYNV